MTAIEDLSVTDLTQAYAARNLSPVEAIDAIVAHIARWEPTLNALWAYEPEIAREAARASEARWIKGEPAGPLDGVPGTLKDNIATKGTPMPVGTAASDMTPAPADAPPAARLRETGAVILAKTTMPDYGMLSSGLSSFHKLARNPWDTRLNPGGSSAGAGAAAAAGYGPIHLGTDIGGSIRLPAGWCGLVGFKPSLGRIPIDPPYVGRVAGPMTRTVADAAAAMRVLSRPDPRDSFSLPPADIDWLGLDGAVADLKGLKVGLMLGIGAGMNLDPEVEEIVVDAAKRLDDAGAHVEPVDPVLTRDMLDGLDDFWRARAWDEVERLPAERRERILPYIRSWAESGAERSQLQAVRGFNRTIEMAQMAARLFMSVDAVLSPVAPGPAFPADLASPINEWDRPFEHIGYTVVWNMSHQPAVSVNAGYTKTGLPVGVQFVGQRFDDLGVLRMAHAFEQIRADQRPWPTPPG